MIVTVLIFVLWNTVLIWPLKVLVVLFHEMAHGAAAILTGGSIEKISITAREGGVAWTRGGSRFAITSAGYVGSLLIGLTLFLAALRSDLDRPIAILFGILVIITAALYMRDEFAFSFSVIAGVVMILAGAILPRDPVDLILRIIGLATMIYVPYDICSDAILREIEGSDASAIAEVFGGTSLLWGLIWLAISIVLIGVALRIGLKEPSNIAFRMPFRGAS